MSNQETGQATGATSRPSTPTQQLADAESQTSAQAQTSQTRQEQKVQADPITIEFKKLDTERSSIRQKLLLDFKDFEAAKQQGNGEVMEIIVERSKDRYERFSELTEKMNRLGSEQAIATLTNHREQARDGLAQIKVTLARWLKKEEVSQKEDKKKGKSDAAIAESLPDIKLPKFTGDPFAWEDWKPLFDSMIHDNEKISVERKYLLLRMYTKGEANEAIRHLPREERYYEVALKILTQKFDRPEKRKKERLIQMRNLPHVAKIEDYEGLKRLHRTAISLIYGLTNPNVKSAFNEVLATQVLEKLPIEFQIKWQRKQRKDEELTLTDLFELIDETAEDYELAYAFQRKSKTSDSKSGTTQMTPRKETVKTTGFPATTAELAAVTSPNPNLQKETANEHRSEVRCPFCGGPHYAVKCPMELKSKMEVVKKMKMCLLCLKKGHNAKECTSPWKRPCSKCKKETHHTALCNTKEVKTTEAAAIAIPSGLQLSALARYERNLANKLFNKVFTKTATVLIEGANGWHRAICYVDDGATVSLIRTSLVKTAQLKEVGKVDMAIEAIGHRHGSRAYNVHRLRIKETFPGAKEISFEAVEREQIARLNALQHTEFAAQLHQCGYRLADDRFLTKKNEPCEVEILIGANAIWEVNGTAFMEHHSGLRAVESKLGWLMLGQDASPAEPQEQAAVVALMLKAQALEGSPSEYEVYPDQRIGDFDVQQFFKYDNLNALDEETDQDEDAVKKDLEGYLKKVTKTTSGRYQAPMRWRLPKAMLKPNKFMCERQLRSVIKRLKSSDQFEEYCKAMDTLEEKGYVEECLSEETEPYFLMPHHPVVREDKTTTKVRVVFNGSAPGGESGPSLNTCLDPGPNLVPDLFDVLLRWRFAKVAFIGDVEQAFHQIELLEEDSKAVRYLWVRTQDEMEKIITFQFKRAVMGLTCSPFMLQAVIRKLLEDCEEDFPEAVKMIANQLFVDDLLGCARDTGTAKQIVNDTLEIFERAKMKIRKFVTNDPELQNHFESLGISGLTDGAITKTSNSLANTLGLKWDMEKDSITYLTEAIVQAAEEKIVPTKRDIFKISARIFDPLGLVAPSTLLVKMTYQDIWEAKTPWDEPVPKPIATSWHKLMNKFKSLADLLVPRRQEFGRDDFDQFGLQLHLFCDASERGYGATAYLRDDSEEGSAVMLMCSKNRVCPLPKKELSIARKELLAVVLGTKLAQRVIASLFFVKLNVSIWTDSMVAMYWSIGDPFGFKPYIRNRTTIIQGRFSPKCLRHCPGKENPADLTSRGVTADVLISSQQWWDGPDWLRKATEFWPKRPAFSNRDVEAAEAEARPRQVLLSIALAEQCNEGEGSLMGWRTRIVESYGHYVKQVRVMAWVMRALLNSRHRQRRYGRLSTTLQTLNVEVPSLTVAEYNYAKRLIWQEVQRSSFKGIYEALVNGEELKPKEMGDLKDLNPVWDPRTQLIRVRGRVQPHFTHSKKRPPLVLPAKHHSVDLYIRWTHERRRHAGVTNTFNYLRCDCWIIRPRQRIKKIIKECVDCNKITSRAFDEEPADIPIDRLRRADPFEVTGLDQAGPFCFKDAEGTKKRAKDGNQGNLDIEVSEDSSEEESTEPLNGFTARGKRRKLKGQKLWVLIFTCAVTRAVHFELVFDFTAESFINAFIMFQARRGECRIIYLDNHATNVCSASAINAIIRNQGLRTWTNTEGIEWRFIPSASPWWGGWWERMVRSLKEQFKKSFRRQALTAEQIRTAVVQIEGIMNSRPLTYVASNAEDGAFSTITPFQVLTARNPRREEDEPDLSEVETGQTLTRAELVDYYQARIEFVNEFWDGFQRIYLNELNSFAAKKGKHKIPMVGEAVLLHDDQVKRQNWKLGIVKQLMPGRDGKVRFAKVKTPAGNIIRRAIQTLHPIEVIEDTYECLEALEEPPPEPQQEPQPETSAEPTPATEAESDEEPAEPFDAVIEVHRQPEEVFSTDESDSISTRSTMLTEDRSAEIERPEGPMEHEPPDPAGAAANLRESPDQQGDSGGEYVGTQVPTVYLTRSGRRVVAPRHLAEFDTTTRRHPRRPR